MGWAAYLEAFNTWAESSPHYENVIWRMAGALGQLVEPRRSAPQMIHVFAQALRDHDVDVPLRDFGIPQQFLAHAKRGEVLADIGLTPAEIAGRIGAALTRIDARTVAVAPDTARGINPRKEQVSDDIV